MGEAKQEETKADAKPAEEKKEEKAEEKKEEAKAEEKKEAAKPSPPQPIILSMDLHCVGCAKKIERCIMRCKGVEEVETDMNQNKVTVKGIVDPQALCTRIKKKTMRTAKVVSPLPPPDAATDSAATAQEVASQVSGMTTVELQVNMHCEACAQQLQRKILKMKGVQTAETELSSGKVKVTGTMTAERLVVDIYRRTGKLASVIPPPPPPPPTPPPAPKEEEKKEEGEKKAEEKPPEEKKEEKGAGGGGEEEKKEEGKAAEQPQDGEKAGETKEGEKGSGSEEAKKEAEPAGPAFIGPEDMMMKRMIYWNNGYFGEDEMAKRMMPAPPPPWTHMPVYFIQPPPPPPQFFSDENPNACCIS